MSSHISTVSFLRTQAKQAGGEKTSRGLALHRAAGHFQMLADEVGRLGRLAENNPERRMWAAAEGIYEVQRMQMVREHRSVVPPFSGASEDTRALFFRMAEVAHGRPLVTAEPDEEDSPASPSSTMGQELLT